ncbi:MAG: C39 family peptidase [Candidatus Bathyarchaeales archaeon]
MGILQIRMHGFDVVKGIIVAEQHYIDVPFYYQVKTYYCGPAALQMVFDFYGENVSQFEIAEVARTVPYVTYTDELRRAAHFSNMSTSMGSEMAENITGYTARKLGYAAFEMWGMTLDELKALIDRDFPIILLMRWIPGEGYGHYRVAVGYNETHIFLHDSWNNIKWGGDYGGPNLAMNYTFFLDMWDYSGCWGLFVSPWNVTVDMPSTVYVGECFKLMTTISYPCPGPFPTYDYPASTCNVTIILPEGLTLADGEKPTKNFGRFQAGSVIQTSWMVKAKHPGNYCVNIEAEGKIGGFVGEKPAVGPSYDYQDRIGGYASSLIVVEVPSQIYIRGIDPAEGVAGTEVCIFGVGATPNGTVVALFEHPKEPVVNISTPVVAENETVGWTVADSDGYWVITFAVPEVPPDTYAVYVVDNETLTSDAIKFVVLAVEVQIRIMDVRPRSGPPATWVYVYGDGATPRGDIRIYFDSVSVTDTTAYEDGMWKASFQVPDVKPGDYAIMALDAASNTTDIAMFTVTPVQIRIIYVSPSFGSPDTQVYVSGDGATTGGEVRVYFDGMMVANTTAKDGWWSVYFLVPEVEPGNYMITALDVVSNSTDTALFTVAFARNVGVKVGDWSRYDVVFHYSTDDPNPPISPPPPELSEIEYYQLTIVSVAGTNVTYEATIHYKNGTELSSVSWLDVSSGQTHYVMTMPMGLLIAANLTAGDKVYLNPYSPTINSTVMGVYAGVQREVNCLILMVNATGPYGYWMVGEYEICWDRASGILDELYANVEYIDIAEGYKTQMLYRVVITETNIWTPPAGLTVNVNVYPKMLNLGSKGKWVICRVELPEGFRAKDVDVSTIMLNGTVSGEVVHDARGVRYLIVKFDRKVVMDLIMSTTGSINKFGTVSLTITGKLKDGTSFQGTGLIRIVLPKPIEVGKVRVGIKVRV